MLYPDRNIKSVGDLLKNLRNHTADLGGQPLWFRGQANKAWSLQPSLFRQQGQNSEMSLLKKFKQNAAMLLNPQPSNDFDWLFIMQHHGVPTRLLDWSESPLVATYFAVNEDSDDDAVLWVLLPVKLNMCSNIEPDYPHDIPSFDEEWLRNYSTQAVASETTSRLLPLAAIAPRNSNRMLAQQGVFTISHRSELTIERIGRKEHVWRYVIPNQFKHTILSELRLLGVSKYQLFPELQSIGELLREV